MSSVSSIKVLLNRWNEIIHAPGIAAAFLRGPNYRRDQTILNLVFPCKPANRIPFYAYVEKSMHLNESLIGADFGRGTKFEIFFSKMGKE